jgi:hypothetical protein
VTKRVPAKNVTAVKERSGGICEGCGIRPATEVHHRKYRSRGGGNEVSNLLDLCGWGNHSGCHGEAHGSNAPEGWAVPSWVKLPILEPVMYRGQRALLDDAGQVHTGPLAVF